MARHAPIRLAGMIAATATFAAAATEASAQQAVACDPLTGSACSSAQVQAGDVLSSVDLDVGVGQLEVSTVAHGNILTGGIDGVDGALTSMQNMRGQTRALSRVVADEADHAAAAVVNTHAYGNDDRVTPEDAAFRPDFQQAASGASLEARTFVITPEGEITEGGRVYTSATANNVAVSGAMTSVIGSVDQMADTYVVAATQADVRYIPAEASFASRAQANAAQVVTTGSSHQDLSVRQVSGEPAIYAETDVYVANAWDVAASADAGANRVHLANEGGSMLLEADQDNQAQVVAATGLGADQYGKATASARAVANETIAGNNDIYLSLDNAQLNSGGVEATAAFQGNTGYDAYVGADAIGNAVSGYVCSQCGGEVNVTNNQVNNGDVSAVVNIGVGSSRAVVAGANAAGNSATFYVSRPGG